MKKYPEFTPEVIEAIEITECNECREICRECNGFCCKGMGCEIFPQDVKKWFNTDTITTEMIVKMLQSKYIQLDWWEGDIREEFEYPEELLHDYIDRSFYLHMRNKYDAAVDGSYGGMCRALGKEGCIISWEKRPTGGKALVPVESHKCESEMSKAECCLAWLPYLDILEEVFDTWEDSEGESHCDYLFRGIEASTKERYEIPWTDDN